MPDDVLTALQLFVHLTDPDTGRAGETRIAATIDPELAAWMMDRYLPARRVAEPAVARIVHALQHPGPDGVAFEEVLIAAGGAPFVGKHLLTAIRRAGLPASPVTVIVGATLPPWLRGDDPAAAAG